MYAVALGGWRVVARTHSVEAARGVERLYLAAWARGERPMTSVDIYVDDYYYGLPRIPADEPMTGEQVDEWFATRGAAANHRRTEENRLEGLQSWEDSSWN